MPACDSTTALRLLVLEPDTDAASIYPIVFPSCALVVAPAISAALAALRTGPRPDLVISEWSTPDCDAAPLLEELRARAIPAIIHAAPSTPAPSHLLGAGLARSVLQKPAWYEVHRCVATLSGRDDLNGIAEQRQERRAHARLATFVRCETWSTGIQRLYTMDLSRNGLALRAPAPASPGAAVQVAIQLPSGARARLSGEVRYSAPLPSAGAASWKIGLRVDQIESAELRALLRIAKAPITAALPE
jgi:CheY-like chemotaxis protein